METIYLRYLTCLIFLCAVSKVNAQTQKSIYESIEVKYKENRFEEVITELNAIRTSSTIDTTTLEYAKLCGIESASYGMLNQFDISIPKSKHAISLLEKYDSTESIIAELLDDIVVDYRLSGDFENAKRAGKELISYSEKHLEAKSVDHASYIIRSSYPYFTFDYPEIGDSIVDVGLDIFKIIGAEMHPDINMAYNCKGIYNKNRGNYEEAAIWYNKAKKVLEFNGLAESQHYVTMLHNEANVLRITGELDLAIENLLKAKEINIILHGKNTTENESVYTGLSNCYILKEEYDIGLEYGKQSLIMTESLYGKESYSYIKNESAYRENLLIANRNEEAIKGHEDLERRILAIFGDQSETYSYYIRQVGKGLKNIGKYDEAVVQLLRSLTDFGIQPENLAAVYKIKKPAAFLSVMSEITDSYYRKWKSTMDITALRKAEKYADLGIRYIELFRKQSLLSNSKLLFTSSHSEYIGQAIQVQYELYEENKKIENFEKGLKYVELSKNILYTENLKSRDIQKSNLIPKDELQMATKIRKEIQKTEAILNETDSDSIELMAQDRLHDLFNKESAWFTKIEESYPEFKNRHYGNWERSVESIRTSHLKEGELILDFLQEDTSYYVLGISATQLSFRIVSDPELSNLNFANAPQKIDKRQLSHLSKLLLQPALDFHKGIETITTMPSGGITYIPFEALPLADGRIALEKYSFRQLIHFESKRNPGTQNSNVLAVVPEYANDWIDEDDEIYTALLRAGQWKLPGAKLESSSIVNLLGGKLLSGTNATKSKFKLISNQYGILHLSMHTLPTDDNVLKSTLVFSSTKDTDKDEHLTLKEIYNLDLDAQMVTLSACNTGIGEHKKGEGIMSIAHAFGIAGASSTVMSLWKVPDESTSQIMISYYQHLKKGFEKDAALKEAKLEYLANTVSEQQKHPFYWAGFVVVGDITPISFNKESYAIFIAGIIIAILLGVSFWYYNFISKRRALSA